MTTFAQVYESTAHNVVSGDDFQSAMDGKYAPQWIQNEIDAGRPWTEVPDTDKNGEVLRHGAIQGDGYEFLNPANPAPVMVFATLTKAQFQLLYSLNGADMTATLAAWPMVAG